jgi:hypothetical protein
VATIKRDDAPGRFGVRGARRCRRVSRTCRTRCPAPSGLCRAAARLIELQTLSRRGLIRQGLRELRSTRLVSVRCRSAPSKRVIWGGRVKFRLESPAPRAFTQAQILPLYPWERIDLRIESLNDGVLAGGANRTMLDAGAGKLPRCVSLTHTRTPHRGFGFQRLGLAAQGTHCGRRHQ